MSGLIGYQQASFICSQTLCCVDDPVLRSLADRNNHAVSREEMSGVRNVSKGAVFIFNHIFKDNTVIFDLHRSHIVLKLNAL